jgi:hypothetical protein
MNFRIFTMVPYMGAGSTKANSNNVGMNCEWLDPTQCVAHLLMISRRKKRLMECLWRKSPNADEGGTMIPPSLHPPPTMHFVKFQIPQI